jgi:hypothetical protein
MVRQPHLRRPETEPRLSELSLGITHVDGSTAVHTNARGAPAIFAHTHVWTVLIVVAGFVVMAAIFARMERVQLPLRSDADRDVGGTSDMVRKPAAVELPRSCSATWMNPR